jgi:uncharacterized protein YbjT (DUF2867 family)
VRVLLTGATGFVGSHLAGFLTRQGLRVVALVRKENDTSLFRTLGTDCSKATEELRLPQSSVETALKKAIGWFQGNGCVHAFGGR